MDPFSMILGIAGSAMSAGAQSAQYGAQAAGERYQAVVAENNATIARRNAKQEIQTGWDNQFHKGLETRGILGTQKAAQGASGIDVTSGSSKLVRDSTYILGRMDEMTIMKTATKKADAYMAQSMNYEADAGLHNFRAEAADTAKQYAVASSLIGGAQSLASKWKPV